MQQIIELHEITQAALKRDALTLRALVQEFLRVHRNFGDIKKPDTADAREMAFAASLVELLAMRSEAKPPSWTREVPASPEPFYLLAYAEKMPRLRRMCHDESPEPLRKRGFYAPPNFLTFA
ncbi:hypothetical protein HY256_03660 [Candidatus Sumerlaeota bacterium]|nr:hypothetical protein [Candidatus Sumerlaeota bacterium]